MKIQPRKRSRILREFADEVKTVNMSLLRSDLSEINRSFESILQKYMEFITGDLCAQVEMSRRIAENRFLAAIDKNASYEIVLREFERIEWVGFSDSVTKIIFFKILWYFMIKNEHHESARARLAAMKRQIRSSLKELQSEISSLDELS